MPLCISNVSHRNILFVSHFISWPYIQVTISTNHQWTEGQWGFYFTTLSLCSLNLSKFIIPRIFWCFVSRVAVRGSGPDHHLTHLATGPSPLWQGGSLRLRVAILESPWFSACMLGFTLVEERVISLHLQVGARGLTAVCPHAPNSSSVYRAFMKSGVEHLKAPQLEDIKGVGNNTKTRGGGLGGAACLIWAQEVFHYWTSVPSTVCP